MLTGIVDTRVHMRLRDGSLTLVQKLAPLDYKDVEELSDDKRYH